MEKITIDVCVRPYYHDVVDTIVRKPKYNSNHNKHYVRYKNKDYVLVPGSSNYVIWMEER